MALRAGVESELYQRLSLPIALKAFVISNPDFTSEDFDSFANSLKNSVPGVMSLQLAPDAIVTYITDIERNKKALGHDLLSDESRRPAVIRSIEERRFIVAGPVNLIQGGRAIIARLPIFLEGFRGRTGLDDFWGFATILIDVDALFSDAGLKNIDPGVALAIRGVDGLGADGGLIVGDASLFEHATRVVDVPLPNGSWQLAAAPKDEALAHDHPVFAAGAILGTVLLVGLVWVLVYRQGGRELRSAKEQAEAASKLKSDFIAVMSHEMRTPLNGILGVLDLLRSTDLSEKQSDYVSTAAAAGEHLLQQVNDVLDLSRVESGLLKIENDPIDIRDIVDSALQVNSTALQAKNLKLESKLLLPKRELSGAPHRIRQVLVNLIGNAVKFTDSGTITVEVKTCSETDELSVVEFSVTDPGIGISEKQQARVFDDFVTLDTGYDRNANGSGLGLAISRRLVEAMSGEIGVESKPGVGSRFWFRIPLRYAGIDFRDAGVATGAQHDRETTVVMRPGTVEALRILLVEDNETNRMVARDLLCLAGHVVKEARDGQEGLEMALAERFDLILMDVSMPRKDGVDATRAIRATEGPNQETPIVGLTAHAMLEERKRFLDAGMNACLSKPIRVPELFEAIGKNCEPTTAGPESAQEESEAVIDVTVLDQLAEMLPPKKFRLTLERVCAEIEDDIPVLAEKLRIRDFEELGERAHKLAGSAAIVGAAELGALLRETETFAKLGDAERSEAAVGRLPVVAGGTIDHLARRLASLKVPEVT